MFEVNFWELLPVQVNPNDYQIFFLTRFFKEKEYYH